jgi:hypothetical protein
MGETVGFVRLRAENFWVQSGYNTFFEETKLLNVSRLKDFFESSSGTTWLITGVR